MFQGKFRTVNFYPLLKIQKVNIARWVQRENFDIYRVCLTSCETYTNVAYKPAHASNRL